MKTTDFKTRGTRPWSIVVVLYPFVAGSGWVLWHKRPWVSDAEKVCRVAELSGCFTDDGSIVFDRCKMMWLERTMWNFGSLAQMPRDGGPGGGDFLRLLAGEQRIELCPEAAKVDREYTTQRQREEAQVSVVSTTGELRQRVAPATHDFSDWLAGGGRVMYLLLFGLAPLVAVVVLPHLRRAVRRTFVLLAVCLAGYDEASRPAKLSLAVVLLGFLPFAMGEIRRSRQGAVAERVATNGGQPSPGMR